MSTQQKQSVVSVSAVMAAGVASATAALVTSRFGVAGTLIGAAMTTMIITGGSAVLKAYLESITGRVRKVPGRVRAQAGKMKHREPVLTEQPDVPDRPDLPGRPDLRNNFVGRLRAAFGWFSRQSSLRRRSILVGALIPALFAFVIGMGAVTGVELGIGNSLSCGIWGACPEASSEASGGTRPSLFGGGQRNGVAEDQDQEQFQDQQTPDAQQQTPSDPAADPSEQPVVPETPSGSDTPSGGSPDQQPAPDPQEPAEQEEPAPVEEEPAPVEEPAPPAGGEAAPEQ